MIIGNLSRWPRKLGLLFAVLAVAVTLVVGWQEYTSTSTFRVLVLIIFSVIAVFAAIVAFASGWLAGVLWTYLSFRWSGESDAYRPVFSKVGIFVSSGIVVSVLTATLIYSYQAYITKKVFNPATTASELDELAHNFLVKRKVYLAQSVARHRAIAPGTLVYLFQHSDIYVRMEVCTNANAGMELLKQCVRVDNPVIVAGLARNPHTPPRMLRDLSTHPDTRVRAAVAIHKSTENEVLEQLGHDKSETVRGLLVYNPVISASLLDKLADDKKAIVRQRVAGNVMTRPETLHRLAQDPVIEVRWQILKNKNISPETISIMAGDQDKRIREYARRMLGSQ